MILLNYSRYCCAWTFPAWLCRLVCRIELSVGYCDLLGRVKQLIDP